MTTIKLIAADMDGTLFNSHHTLSPRTVSTLQAAMQRGVAIVVATGRARSALSLQAIGQLNLTTPSIHLQGTVVHHSDGALLHSFPLSPDLIGEIVTLAESERFNLFAYSGTDLFSTLDNPYLHHVGHVMHEGESTLVESLHRVVEGGYPIHKIALWERAERLPTLRAMIAERFNGTLRLLEALPASLLAGGGGVPASLEMLPAGSSKGAALSQLLTDDFNLTPAEVLALGDGENDLELLQVAGVGVAMGNAAAMLKDAADVIAPSNDEDGVAWAIEKYVL